MTVTILQIAFQRLWNNKRELLLMLAVPILFFSIFAMIFCKGVGTGTPAVKLALVDDDQSRLSQKITSLLREQPAMVVDAEVHRTNEAYPIERMTKDVIKARGVDVLVYLPRGMQSNIQNGQQVTVQMLSDGSNPVGKEIVNAVLSQTIAVALSEVNMSTGIVSWFRNRAKARRMQMRYEQRGPSETATIESSLSAPEEVTVLRPAHTVEGQGASRQRPRLGKSRPDFDKLVTVAKTDVYALDKNNPKIAMYAAGIAVMFLLFSAINAGGSLLEEQEAGTLDRILSSRLSITSLLAGKWLYIACVACVQMTVMFVWAQLAFGVDLLGHLPGFVVMTLCTAAATASLALCLAVFCQSRAQLNAVSIVLILTMSALGGSMVPRYLMSEEMRRWGQLTFNAWALDGFKKIFWQDLPVSALQPEVTVLLVMALLLLCVARMWADRWAAA